MAWAEFKRQSFDAVVQLCEIGRIPVSMPNSRPPLQSIPISFVVTVVFMVLLWIAVPLAWLTWVLVIPWQSGPHVTLRNCMQWFVVNLMAFVQRGLLGWLVREPSVDFAPWHQMGRLAP